ncbi:flavoprotein, putative [Syntrophotalea carbinolica DSM 2380]|uniref:Flavoprotein, putative n=1 Tax=Syntrophotalea carbinolica (strain DSM 2380 / NBRC 103641 / GraBd1) TaxID=338963 RepID=Q3A1S0_SYNC1|nr:NAD(P)H-dependent oxidoreductase [Syntrophotalea carbinolica]ABA89687.1 flavoprotein, putative [Syntrophotalea carbinolica DSM 2380]
MKIIVLNGSPKGEQSITMQYVRYLGKKFPQHEFPILHIARDIQQIEGNPQRFKEILESIAEADGVLWGMPLYYLMVHAHLKRFIELLWERQVTDVFKGKYALAIATSVHFYDHTALQYMRTVCADLQMCFIDAFSADMQDLLKEQHRRQLLIFAENAFRTIEQHGPTFTTPLPAASTPPIYLPGADPAPLDTHDRTILIITDAVDPEDNQSRMVKRLLANFGNRAEVVNLHDLNIKSSCMGCIQCGYDNRCPLEDLDDFIPFYRDKVMTADILIYAGTIKDRYLSARWKSFFDRSFFMGHTPTVRNKQVGIILAGPLSQNGHLREILEGYFEMMQANLVGIVGDESDGTTPLDILLDLLAQRLIAYKEQDYIKPRTFLGIAGSKLLRDEIWGRLRFPFVADHRFFKHHKGYDFPHRNWRVRLKNGLLLLLARMPPIRKKIYRQHLKGEMIKSLQKVVDEA